MKVFYVFLFDELEETLALQGDRNSEYDRKVSCLLEMSKADYGWTMHHEEV